MSSFTALLAALISLVVVSFGVPAAAAPPAVPTAIPYQGLLLDSGGSPQTGTVDLTLRVYDALSGGTLLYKQVLLAVPLTDGVFSVTLGPSGAGTDTPVNPLTTSLTEALAGDLGATGPSRFLEVTAGTSGPLARTQIVSVPYALHADSADSAQSAEFAESAGDVSMVNGLPSSVLSEIFEHFDFDGGGPPATDPLEGTGDVDGDGIANFVDADNDGDTLSDADEVSNGTGVNLVTPIVSGVNPPATLAFVTSTVTVLGLNFQPGLSVIFGSETPTPTLITPTSFRVTVGPQDPGPTFVTVTLPNGESDTLDGAGFFQFPSGVNHGLNVAADRRLTLDLSANLLPVIGGVNQFARNDDLDGQFELASYAASGGNLAAAWDPNDETALLRCRSTGAVNCAIELDRGGVVAPVEGLVGATLTLHGPAIQFDGAGRAVLGYVKVSASRVATLARDTTGDGDFADPGEIRTIATLGGSQANGGDLAVDASGRAAYAYYDTSSDLLRVAYDRSGDGDFSDTVGGNPELFTVTSAAAISCLGVTFDDGARLTLIWDAGAGPQLGRDANADGDLADAGEVVALSASPALACDADGDPAGGGLAVAHDADGLHLLFDRDDDGGFTGAAEDLVLAPAGAGNRPISIRQRGNLAVATGTQFFFDPLLAP